MENTETQLTGQTQVITDAAIVADIIKMVKANPNDQDLGAEIREYVWKLTHN